MTTTKFECGCRIVCEHINLNRGDLMKPQWEYLLKTFVNVCGKCGKKQTKFNIWKIRLWKWRSNGWRCLYTMKMKTEIH